MSTKKTFNKGAFKHFVIALVVVTACLVTACHDKVSFRDCIYSHIKNESLGLKSPWIGDVSHVQSVYYDYDSTFIDSYYDKEGYLTKQIIQKHCHRINTNANANVCYGRNHELDSIVIDEGNKHTVVFQNCYADSIVIEATISENDKVFHNKRVFCFGDTIVVLSREEAPMRNFLYDHELSHKTSSLEDEILSARADYGVEGFIYVDADSMKLDYVSDEDNGHYKDCYKTEYFEEVWSTVKLARQIGGEFSFYIFESQDIETDHWVNVCFSQELPFVLSQVNDEYNNHIANGGIEKDEKGNTIRDFGWSHTIEYR